VRSVVGAVLHEGIVRDALLVKQVKHLAHILVVVDHHVVILGLPPPGFSCVRKCM